MTTNGSASQPPFEKILIVGAGPSGLLLALILAQHRIPTLVLEAWPHLDTRLRATQYGTPATRIFRRAGILSDIRAASIPSFPSICWRRVADGRKLCEIDLSVTAGEEDRMTVLQLGEIVQIMYRHCTERFAGLIEVRFEHRVVGVGQDEEGRGEAWLDVEVGEERLPERVTADYIVGCDGAASAVRRSLFGRDWPGQTFGYKFIVQNVYYPGFEQHGWDGGNYMVDREHWGLIARRGHGGMWRVTYGDNVPGLSDAEYEKRREWHFREMLPGRPEPGEYRVEQTNMYAIHNRCVESFRVGRVLLAADAAHVCNPMGGYGCMSACLDVGGLADCLIGYYEGKAGEEILDTYAQVRRDIFLKYIDARSVRNLKRCAESDPYTVAETDKFFGILREMEGDKERLKEFLLKRSSIEYDFTQHYDKRSEQTNGQPSGTKSESAEEIQMIANQNV